MSYISVRLSCVSRAAENTMSIYDLPNQDSPKSPAKGPVEDSGKKTPPKPTAPQAAAPAPSPYSNQGTTPESGAPKSSRAEPPRKKTKRRGCGSCLLGCFGVLMLGAVLLAGGSWFAWSQWPNWARATMVARLEEADLSAEQQEAVITQLDRLIDGFRSGEVTPDHLVLLAERLGRSPLSAAMFASAAERRYVETSGLDEREKRAARTAIQRVALGVVDRRIEPEKLNEPLDFISTFAGDGSRQLRPQISDEDLRKLTAQCKTLADEARVPPGIAELDFGYELERVIDGALEDEWN